MSARRPESVAALSALVRDAAASSSASRTESGFRIRGAGTWLSAGRSATGAAELDLSAFNGVRAYAADDLTISVGTATTLAEVDRVTRAAGQWCPLLAWGDDSGTVGATVATATTGPFANALGRPRDLVLGLECVDGRGRVVRAGGRVVKNVAGFDLTRLMTGAWGTLGVITELHLRLRARPAVDETFAIAGSGSAFDDAVREVARGAYAPLGLHAIAPADAAALGAGVNARWLVRLGGNRAFVAAARAAYAGVGALESIDPRVWDAVRVHAAPAARPELWRWDALSRRIKTLFDPHDLLNRGLLGALE